jgi:invasion protein IalB
MKTQTRHRAIAPGALAAILLTLSGTGFAQAQQSKPAAAGAAAAGAGQQTPWVKLCESVSATRRDKDGKESKENKNLCLTSYERLDGATGMVMISAAIRQLEGVERQHLMMMVPLGMILTANMRAAIYPKDMWAKVIAKEKVDETKLMRLDLRYNLCHPAGCTAEAELPKEALEAMKSGGGIVAIAIGANGQPVAFPVPLDGFGQTVDGKPMDGKVYEKARAELMKQIRERQEQMLEQYQKEQAAKAAAPAGAAAKK